MADLDWTNIITTGVGGLLGWLGARTAAKSSEATTKTTTEADLAGKGVDLEATVAQLQGDLVKERQQGRLAVAQAALTATAEVQQQETTLWSNMIVQAFASLQEIERGNHGRRNRDKALEKHLALIDQITNGERAREYFKRQSLPLVEQAKQLIAVAEQNAAELNTMVVLQLGEPERTIDLTAGQEHADTPVAPDDPADNGPEEREA